MSFWSKWFGKKVDAGRLVGAKHIGAFVEKVREHDPLELPGLLQALTDGELADLKVSLEEDPDDGTQLVLTTQHGTWKLPEENGAFHMVKIARALNRALASAAAPRRFYLLESRLYAFATPDHATTLAKAGLLGASYEAPAEQIQDLPFQAGTLVELWPSGFIKEGTLARDHEIEGVGCAAGKIVLGYRGTLEKATLARKQTLFGLELPAGTEIQFWDREHEREPLWPYQATIRVAVTIGGLHIPASSLVCWPEEPGRPPSVFLAEDDGGELTWDPQKSRWLRDQ